MAWEHDFFCRNRRCSPWLDWSPHHVQLHVTLRQQACSSFKHYLKILSYLHINPAQVPAPSFQLCIPRTMWGWWGPILKLFSRHTPCFKIRFWVKFDKFLWWSSVCYNHERGLSTLQHGCTRLKASSYLSACDCRMSSSFWCLALCTSWV